MSEKKKKFKATNLNKIHKPEKTKKSSINVSARRSLTVLGKKPATRAAAPKPINVPSLRKENHGLDIHVKLVGEGGWASTAEDSKVNKEIAATSAAVQVPQAPQSASQAAPEWNGANNAQTRVGSWGDDAMNEEVHHEYPGLSGGSGDGGGGSGGVSNQRNGGYNRRPGAHQSPGHGASAPYDMQSQRGGDQRQNYRDQRDLHDVRDQRGSSWRGDRRDQRDTRSSRGPRDAGRREYQPRGYGDGNQGGYSRSSSYREDRRSDIGSEGGGYNGNGYNEYRRGDSSMGGGGGRSRSGGGDSRRNEHDSHYQRGDQQSSSSGNDGADGGQHWADRGYSRYDDKFESRNDRDHDGGENNNSSRNDDSSGGNASAGIAGHDEARGGMGQEMSNSPMKIARRDQRNQLESRDGASSGDNSGDNSSLSASQSISGATNVGSDDNNIGSTTSTTTTTTSDTPIIPEYESRRAPVILDSTDMIASGPKKLFDPASGKYVEVSSKQTSNGAPKRGRSRGGRQQQQPKRNSELSTTSTSKDSQRKMTAAVPVASDATKGGPPMSKLMEQLQRNRTEKERKQNDERDRQQQERVAKRKKRQEERASRGPRTCGVKFTGDVHSGYVNVDAWDVRSQANVTLQRMLAASSSIASAQPSAQQSAQHPPTQQNTTKVVLSPTSSTLTNPNGNELLTVGSSSSSVWGQHGASSASNAWSTNTSTSQSGGIIGKPNSPNSNASPTSGSASNPYAAAFASSLQQSFVRSSSEDNDPSGVNSPRSEDNSNRQAALYANFMNVANSSADVDDGSMSGGGGDGGDGGDGDGGDGSGGGGSGSSGGSGSGGNGGSGSGSRARGESASSGGINNETGDTPDESNSLTRWGQSAGGVNPAAMEFVPSFAESPTMSPQFSAMKPADNAEFNVVSFPGRSLMGAPFGDMPGSRSLLQSDDSSMLQQPFQHHLLQHSGPSLRVSGNESTQRSSASDGKSDAQQKKVNRNRHQTARHRNKKKSNNRDQSAHRKKEGGGGGGGGQQRQKKEKKQRSRKKSSQSQQTK